MAQRNHTEHAGRSYFLNHSTRVRAAKPVLPRSMSPDTDSERTGPVMSRTVQGTYPANRRRNIAAITASGPSARTVTSLTFPVTDDSSQDGVGIGHHR